jgi:catechol 2,3-dioxygenase-like lactoylglutathione lyase family enzyme
MSDVGLTHVALLVSHLDASIAFYSRYARMEVVHRRQDGHSEVAWLSDKTRPFVIVLIQITKIVPRPVVRLVVKLLFPFEHLGVGCASRDEIDQLCQIARTEGCLRLGPKDSGPPLGYWCLLSDPDGHTLELSHGQEVGLTVERAA